MYCVTTIYTRAQCACLIHVRTRDALDMHSAPAMICAAVAAKCYYGCKLTVAQSSTTIYIERLVDESGS